MKHKWCNEIVAWADGAEIEVCKTGVWYGTDYPDFNDTGLKFRIKPQPKEPKYVYVYLNGNNSFISIRKLNDYKYIGKIEVQDDD